MLKDHQVNLATPLRLESKVTNEELAAFLAELVGSVQALQTSLESKIETAVNEAVDAITQKIQDREFSENYQLTYRDYD